MLEINSLSFGFKSTILKDISLSIEQENKVIALLGPNGSGKTTFLNVLSNYYQKYTGDIKNPYSVLLLPDAEFIPKDMSLVECIRDFSVLYDNFNNKRVQEMLNFLELDNDKKVSDYSKGMKEQLHLVFALGQDVDIYLLDEPLAAVDSLTRDVMIELILNYRKPNSMVIISTHLIQDMEYLFDEVVMMNKGRIVLYETTTNLLAKIAGENLDGIYKKVITNESIN